MEASDRARVERTLAGVFGDVDDVERLTGGASRQTWVATIAGRRVIAQRGAAGSERDMRVECHVLAAAETAGVPAPRAIDCVEDDDGVVTLITEFVEGETIARRILRDDEFGEARTVLVAQLGRAMARVHRIPIEAVPALTSVDEPALYRAHLDEIGEPHPAFELAFRWLDEHRTGAGRERQCVVHGDFRLGNVIVDRRGLGAIIDWELAHLGNPLQDLGWMCVPAWRFGSDRPAAGLGSREELLAAYNAEAGTGFTVDDLRWWEVYGIVRWGVMCLTQAHRHLSGSTRSHELAAIGRRVCENEHDLFLALDGRW